MGALLSFLGGSVFRMIWGEVSHYITAKQEQANELARMEMQGKLDAAQHSMNMEALRVQAELGVKTIQVQAEADLSRLDAAAFNQAVADVGRITGIKFIDFWNQSIRPWLATMATVMVMVQFYQHNFVMTDWDMELVGAVLGMYVADRSLAHRGK